MQTPLVDKVLSPCQNDCVIKHTGEQKIPTPKEPSPIKVTQETTDLGEDVLERKVTATAAAGNGDERGVSILYLPNNIYW